MHPQLDLFDEIVRVFGWPALLGALVWLITTYKTGQRELREMHKNTEVTLQSVTEIKTNHLPHLQDGISQVAKSNDKAVEVLQEISTGIKILTDRDRRN